MMLIKDQEGRRNRRGRQATVGLSRGVRPQSARDRMAARRRPRWNAQHEPADGVCRPDSGIPERDRSGCPATRSSGFVET